MKANYERGPVNALNVPPFNANIKRLSLFSNKMLGLLCNDNAI